MTLYEYEQEIDRVNELQYAHLNEKGNKMLTIKEICRDLIGPMNYKEDTKRFVEKVYKRYGLDLERINGLDLLHGTPEIPKLMSVLRRVQLTKKDILRRIRHVEAHQAEKAKKSA
jgi:hypothetical protein